MLTIIMPFYKKYQEFVFVFENYNFFEMNNLSGLTLIIVMDDPQDSDELAHYLKKFVNNKMPNFSVKVIMNPNSHSWRCPSHAINVGIRYADQGKLIVLSPETIICQDSLLSLIKYKNNLNYCVGIIKHLRFNLLDGTSVDDIFNKINSIPIPYGSICFDKFQAEKIGGYDERFLKWGGDDDDFRFRLKMAGYMKLSTFAKFIHVSFSENTYNRSPDKNNEISEEAINKKVSDIYSNRNYVANNGEFGFDFDQVIFDYKPDFIAV